MLEGFKVDRWDRKTNFGCNSCMFFVPKRHGEFSLAVDDGRCRRNAPTLKGFLVVFIDDWCGEHKLGSNPIRDRGYAKENKSGEKKD